jgi:hypothetical protein
LAQSPVPDLDHKRLSSIERQIIALQLRNTKAKNILSRNSIDYDTDESSINLKIDMMPTTEERKEQAKKLMD